MSAFAGAGVYAARAVRGVEKGKGTALSGPYSIYNLIEFRTQNPENDGAPTIINPFDFGFNITAGVERQGIELMLTYGQGFQRVFPHSLVFEEQFTTRVLTLSTAYFFRTKGS